MQIVIPYITDVQLGILLSCTQCMEDLFQWIDVVGRVMCLVIMNPKYVFTPLVNLDWIV